MPCTDIRFLVVEDHEFQRNGIARILKSLGASEVHLAADGREAIHVLRDPDRPVDIIISDLSMPGMDGMELTRHLGDVNSKVSLILLSSLEHDLILTIANMARAYKVQMLGVMCKPPSVAKLIPLMQQFKALRSPSSTVNDGFSFDEIAQAWADDNFEAWVEPRIDLNTGIVRGVEISPRWRRGELETLTPDAFMPSLRALGLNDDFVWLMIRKAFSYGGWLQQQGHELTVCVGLGFDNLNDLDIAPRIQRIADAVGVQPRLILLGVTEGALDTASPRIIENLARLRILGFGLVLDEFGSGDMAVERLSLVPFTELKIMSSFIQGAADLTIADAAGIATGLEVAQKLRLKSIGSGITTEEQLTLLRQWGCEYGQGPLISDPLPTADLPLWLASRAPRSNEGAALP